MGFGQTANGKTAPQAHNFDGNERSNPNDMFGSMDISGERKEKREKKEFFFFILVYFRKITLSFSHFLTFSFSQTKSKFS